MRCSKMLGPISAGFGARIARLVAWGRCAIALCSLGAPALAQSLCEPGFGAAIACPCGNTPSGPGRGCDNSASTGGAALIASGNASLSNDTVVITVSGVENMGPSCTILNLSVTSILIQGNATSPSSPFFDGVRCVGGALKRIEANPGSGGVFTSSVGISATSAALGDVLTAGDVRYYFLWYRDPCPTFACTGPNDVTNVSNSWKITWTM